MAQAGAKAIALASAAQQPERIRFMRAAHHSFS
jgi:hypothetical protein